MQTVHQAPIGSKSLRTKLFHLFRLSTEPTIKLYRGFGHTNCFTIYGHVLNVSAFPRRKYRRGIIRNTLALLRLFMVKPAPCADVELEWKGSRHKVQAENDGFFKFEWEDSEPFDKGWLEVKVAAYLNQNLIATATGHVYVPEETQYIFISDIDDTFLISHSGNLRKRLFVLFTNNARSRKPFEGVVRHYQLLQLSGTTKSASNPFFYVSSSEWNLYDYLVEFMAVNRLPKGVLLLNQLKQFSQLLKTGQNNHQTKFTRIVRILEAYPKHRVVLLGDSSQQDPYIYESVVKHFPQQVHAVYIRDIHKKKKTVAAEVLKKIESAGVPCCFFQHSSDAILHSIKIGLIAAQDAEIKMENQVTNS